MDATAINTVSGIGSREVSALVGLRAGKAIIGRPPTGAAVEDIVELSPAGMALSRADVQSPPRFAPISEIRAAIKAGTFETPECVDETVKRLLRVVG